MWTPGRGLWIALALAAPLAAQTTWLASEPFSAPAGALHGVADGAGWAAPWQVQNNNTSIPGYNVSTQLTLGAGSYAVGGSNWQTAGRTLDTTVSGPFAGYVTNGLIGAAGQSIFFGALLRMDVATGDEISLTLHNGANPAWYVASPGIAIGYFGSASNAGGVRYWSFKLDGVVRRTAVPITVGKAARLTLRIDFAATTTVSLFVDAGSTLPATADAAATSTRTQAFRSVAYNGGTGSGESSIDELRFAGSYAALTGASSSGGSTGTGTGTTTVPAATPRLGSNLSAVADYARELPFVDAFRSARPWISQATGKPWGQGPALALDANGWIASLQPGQWAETILLDNALDDQSHYPAGDYTLLYDGEGTIAFDLQSASVVSQTAGRMVVRVAAGGNGVFLMETATNPLNPLRNIRFLMPGFEGSYLASPFHPTFLQSLSGYKTLRFMEWSLTNGSTVQNWADRAAPADYTWTLRGVPLEVQIQLANTLNVTPWFNIPAQATDDYVRQFAATVQSRLNPGLSFYLEYSNETWNGAFSQNSYLSSRGMALGLSSDPTVAAAYYTALRSTQIFAIVRGVLTTPSRMIRVIASQAANSWLSDQTLGYGAAYKQADALAIAPYFNCSDASFGMLGDPATASQVAAMTVDQIVDIELQHVNGCALDQMKSSAAVAKKYGVKLVGYEGGQSLVGFGGAENNATLTSLFKAANRSPRMYSVYTTYLQNWVAAGGDLFVHFTDVTAYTKYGSWGSLEYQDQDPNTAPKYLALKTFAAAH